MNNSNSNNIEVLAGDNVTFTTSILSNNKFQILMALLFGVVVVATVGLLPMEVLHNAAHDVRHIHAFPCH